jgi:hypothetical protein
MNEVIAMKRWRGDVNGTGSFLVMASLAEMERERTIELWGALRQTLYSGVTPENR